MDLYQITKSGLKAVEKSAFDLERDIQALVEANLCHLFGFIQSLYRLSPLVLLTKEARCPLHLT